MWKYFEKNEKIVFTVFCKIFLWTWNYSFLSLFDISTRFSIPSTSLLLTSLRSSRRHHHSRVLDSAFTSYNWWPTHGWLGVWLRRHAVIYTKAYPKRKSCQLVSCHDDCYISQGMGVKRFGAIRQVSHDMISY